MGLPPSERDGFAKRCGSTRKHLTNIAYGKVCGEKLAIEIERESGGVVRCEEQRPDVDWGYLRNTQPIVKAAAPGVIECGAIDPRHGERRRTDLRKRIDRREDGAA